MNSDSFVERLRWGLEWRRLQLFVVADTLIGVLLGTMATFARPEKGWAHHFAVNLVFSHAIGTTIYLLILLTGVLAVERTWKRWLGFTGVFILGGLIGASLGLCLCALFETPDISAFNLRDFVIGNTFLAVFFGTVVTGYFLLREKLEDAAARLAEKEVHEQRLLRLKTRAELEALRAKINPHFLFNTLNSIASLIPVDPARAEDMVQKLAHLFRHALDASTRDLMRLSDELRVIREYLEIEKVRLGDRLSYAIDSDPALDNISIPGLILQPLVENSVRHGIAPTRDGGRVTVRCSREGDFCRIEIEDNGRGYDTSRMVEGFGLGGVRERLELHYGAHYAFQIETGQGVRIAMRLPVNPSH